MAEPGQELEDQRTRRDDEDALRPLDRRLRCQRGGFLASTLRTTAFSSLGTMSRPTSWTALQRRSRCNRRARCADCGRGITPRLFLVTSYV